MQINHRKSQVSMENIDKRERSLVLNLFPFHHQQLESPFKYLGFWLKPSAYKIEDWNWLIAKIEARISHWSHKWLSRVGRLTLIKSVLLAIPVYWAALTWVPKAKSGWRLISTENLWTRVVRRKYIDLVPLEDWIRSQEKRKKNVSVVLKATVEAFSVIEQGLAWKIGDGRHYRIGRDPWGDTGEYTPKDGYNLLMQKKGWGNPDLWSKLIWKLKGPAKAKIFLWCMLKRKVPTWDTLRARYLVGPGRCPLCKTEEESINHLFISCAESKKIWGELSSLLNIKAQLGDEPLEAVWSRWWQTFPEGNMRILRLIYFSGVWIARNKSLFQDKDTPVHSCSRSQTSSKFLKAC
eukprot:PITA_07324